MDKNTLLLRGNGDHDGGYDRGARATRERCLNRKQTQSITTSSSSSSCSLCLTKQPSCSSGRSQTTAAELACSVCCFCVSCPLCILWCCIKQPSTICWRAARKARRRWGCCGGGSAKRVLADYSSFSDIDSDDVKCKLHSCSKRIR